MSAPVLAHAQDDTSLRRDELFARDRNVSVRQRPRPEYAESPERLGAFLLTPTVTASIEGNDNVFATSNNTQSDTIFRVQPSAVLATDWSRHALSIYGRASFNEYADHSTENTTDYQVGATGRLDVQRTLGFSGGGSYERDTEPRTSSGSPADVKNPIRYNVGSIYAQGTKEFNRRPG